MFLMDLIKGSLEKVVYFYLHVFFKARDTFSLFYVFIFIQMF